MLELMIREDVLTSLPQIIEFNFDELTRELDVHLEKYTNLVFTDENIPEAKEYRATLNKFYDAVDAERKRIKKEWNKPFAEFESKMKILTEKINKPKQEIDKQIKAYEDSEREAKTKEIEKYFSEKSDNLPLELHVFFSSEWLNKTFTMKKIKEAIDETITNFRNGLAVIENLNSPYEAHIKQMYYTSLDLATAISSGEKQGQVLESMKAKVLEIPAPEKPAVQITSIPNTTEIPEAVDIRIFVTKEQKAALKEFLRANNITYTNVPYTAVS